MPEEDPFSEFRQNPQRQQELRSVIERLSDEYQSRWNQLFVFPDDVRRPQPPDRVEPAPQPDNEQDQGIPDLVFAEPDPAQSIQLEVTELDERNDPLVLYVPRQEDAQAIFVSNVCDIGFKIFGSVFWRRFSAAAEYAALYAPLENLPPYTPQPPRPDWLDPLLNNIRQSALELQARIEPAVRLVETTAVAAAERRLNASIQNTSVQMRRYFFPDDQLDDRAEEILANRDNYPGQIAGLHLRGDDGFGLVRSLFMVLAANDVLENARGELQRQQQPVILARARFVAEQNFSITPGALPPPEWSEQLENWARERFPDPVDAENLAAAVGLAESSLVEALRAAGQRHPIVYKVWHLPSVRQLRDLFRSGALRTPAQDAAALDDFRLKSEIIGLLRETREAAEDLRASLLSSPAHVWRYPPLVSHALRDANLREGSLEWMAAEERLREQQNAGALAIANMLAGGAEFGVAIAGAAQPVLLIVTILSIALSATELLFQFFETAEARNAFSATLDPADAFIFEDRSYMDVIVGTAFVLAGLRGTRIGRTVR